MAVLVFSGKKTVEEVTFEGSLYLTNSSLGIFFSNPKRGILFAWSLKLQKEGVP